MAIHTQAITYSRGIPRTRNGFYNNFFLGAQANYTIISPMSSYLRGYQFNNRNYINLLPAIQIHYISLDDHANCEFVATTTLDRDYGGFDD